jgi:hypothetical protein
LQVELVADFLIENYSFLMSLFVNRKVEKDRVAILGIFAKMARTESIALQMIRKGLPGFVYGIVSKPELGNLVRKKAMDVAIDASVYCNNIAVCFAKGDLISYLSSKFVNGSFFERMMALEFFMILLRSTEDEEILCTLSKLRIVDDCCEVFETSHFGLIRDILLGFLEVWKKCLIGGRKLCTIYQCVLNLMNDEEFLEVVQGLKGSMSDEVRLAALKVCSFLSDYGIELRE